MQTLMRGALSLALIAALLVACGGDDDIGDASAIAGTTGGGAGGAGRGDDGGTTGCGARLGDTCSDDEYCAYEPEQLCGAADASSICRPRPTACDLNLKPVCGCDGNTYSNACEANAAGTGLLADGECEP